MNVKSSGKMLFVDDEECIRELASEVFKESGYQVETAVNGMEALEKLWGSVFDVVVTDIMMPKLDGIELYYGAIRENPYLKERFVFTTGLPSLKTVSFLAQTNCPHLYKPYQITDLIKTVESLQKSKTDCDEKRIAKRFDLVTEGLLTDALVNKISPLVVETQDISKSGVRLKYFGAALVKDVTVELNLRAMDIKRHAKVVWSNTVNERSFSGLTFS
jgi:CheY-like chemotaxis protein